ncbi:MAG: hypothetical protein C5B55_12555 [Blastocatellia bacterium]|nr:MAG: hypothetical protein C5B55_12555 [Blastocatellia bacterium]
MLLAPNEYRSQTKRDRRPLLFWSGVVLMTLLFCSLIIAAPLASAAGHTQVALTIYQPFGLLCHQLPERSFFIAGHKFAVCARCTGIYAGFALTLLGYPLIRSLRSCSVPPRKWLFLGAVPLLIDFSLGFFGIWLNTHSSRFATGFLFGAVVVFYVMPAVAELSQWRLSKRVRPALQTFTVPSPEAVASASSDYSAPERRI